MGLGVIGPLILSHSGQVYTNFNAWCGCIRVFTVFICVPLVKVLYGGYVAVKVMCHESDSHNGNPMGVIAKKIFG